MRGWTSRHTSQAAFLAVILFAALLVAGAPGYVFFLLAFAGYALFVAELRLREDQRVRGLPVRGRLPGRLEFFAGVVALIALVVGMFFGVQVSPVVAFGALLLLFSERVATERWRWRREDALAEGERRQQEFEAELAAAAEQGLTPSEWGALDRRERIAKLRDVRDGEGSGDG